MSTDRGAGPTSTDDAAAWDSFVEACDPGSYLQLRGWATVKAVNGWSAVRLARTLSSESVTHADRPPGPPAVAAPREDQHGARRHGAAGDPVTVAVPARVGAQVLVRRPRLLPWGFAYAPRGPVASAWTPETVLAFTDAMRADLDHQAGSVSHVRIDPEIERDGPFDAGGGLRRALSRSGWRPAPPIQPETTRIIDLAADESALWSGLRKKWRQYVNRARSGGFRVVDADADRLPEFYAIYRETATRAGFLIRTEQAYRDVWNAYRPAGRARLLLAENADGEAHAALFLVRCGGRVVEPYGGMTGVGADARANYLLKWEAIRTSREQGATTYDLWGLASPGIAHFKAGFGGREVRYVGAWDLVLNPVGRVAFEAGQWARVRVARRRHGLPLTARSAVSADDAG